MRALDLVLRLAFFAVAPFVLVVLTALFPITGALINIGLALAIFLAGEAARSLAEKNKIVARIMKPQLAFDGYYRDHKPKPFPYYVFYPFLFPYWLFVREARREFWLYKGYTLTSVGILIVSAVYQYFHSFQPELGMKRWALATLITIVIETLAVLGFLLPIVTTVVHFHLERAPKRLAAVLVVGLLSTALAIIGISRKRDPVVSYVTRERVRWRTSAKPQLAEKAQLAALENAWRILPHDPTGRAEVIDRDGKVEGEPLLMAHETLEAFYKHDEAFAFDLWWSRTKKDEILVVYFEASGKRGPIWLAMGKDGKSFHDPKRLPSGAFRAMKLAADDLTLPK